MPEDRAAFGAFLRSRRDRLTPAQAGVEAFPGPRRVPGLRREELAVVAGVSADYLRRLEQGRQANVSGDVLLALSRALRLDDVERAHLLDLAAPTTRARPVVGELPQRADAGLLRLMTALDHLPAVLLGRRAEVLAQNRLHASVLGHALGPGTSFIRFLFLEPTVRERIRNWPECAAAAIGGLRREAARRPDDRRLTALIDHLCAADADAARWWADHGVRDYTSLGKLIDHPAGGMLAFDVEVAAAPHDPDQRLVVYTAAPDSPTARVLPLIASWEGAHASSV